jgi:hypothetical protein
LFIVYPENCKKYVIVIGGINKRGDIGYATTSNMSNIVKKKFSTGLTSDSLNIQQTDAGVDNMSGWSDL